MELKDAAEEVKYLQRCMCDLVGVLALPAMWSGQEPRHIVTTFHDALMATLNLDFLYTRARIAPDREAIEILRTAPPYAATTATDKIRDTLRKWFGDDPNRWPAEIRSQLSGRKISLLSMRLGIAGEIGIVIAGSERADFPTHTERLILGVAANQAAVGLQQARLLSEQKGLASELLERSEARYRVVVETAHDAVISMNERGLIILANPATKRIFGHEPADLIGKPLTVLMPGSMRTLHESGYRRYLDTGQRHLNWQGIELAALRANGEEFPAEISFGEMTSGGQRVFTGFIRDISERKRAEELIRATERNLALTRAELANVMRAASLGALTASIAHEVNQPLAGIVMNASTCLRMLDSNPPNVDGARETARRTIRDGNRASEVVTRLRALFRTKEVAADSIDLSDAAREVIALSLSELQTDRVVVVHDFAEDLPAVKGDRIQLQQVILNLVHNASEAMRDVDGRPRQLLIKTESDGSHGVRLTVQDTGIGFAPDAADRLFESFYTTKDDGMGIGLSVSRSIIEAHGGRLWAWANDGPGSSFAFSIPHDSGAPD